MFSTFTIARYNARSNFVKNLNITTRTTSKFERRPFASSSSSSSSKRGLSNSNTQGDSTNSTTTRGQSETNAGSNNTNSGKTNWKPVAILGLGFYVGLCAFKGTFGDKNNKEKKDTERFTIDIQPFKK